MFNKQLLEPLQKYVNVMIITSVCLQILENARYTEKPIYNSLMFVNMILAWIAILLSSVNPFTLCCGIYSEIWLFLWSVLNYDIPTTKSL